MRDIGDVRLALEGAFETAAPQAAAAIAASTPAARLPWAIAAIAVVMAIAVPAVMYIRSARHADAPPILRFEIDDGVSVGGIALSPDGRRLVSAGRSGTGTPALLVRSLDQLTPQLLEGTTGTTLSFWSPDGRSIAFFADRRLKRVDLLGGSPQTLCDASAGLGGTWNRDGVILFGTPNSPIRRISASGGAPQPVTEFDKARAETDHRAPFFLPDGNHFLFLALSAKAENSALFIGSLDSRDRTFVMTSSQPVVFAAPSHLMFLRGNTLVAQEFDLNQLRPRGDPVPVAERVQPTLGSFTVSANGILAYRPSAFGDDLRQLSIVDRTGKGIDNFGARGLYQNPVLSPNQQLVASNRADQSNDIWIEDLNRGTTSRLTFDPGADDFPVWSPDNARIVFSSDRDGGVFQLYEKPSAGGQEQLLLKTGQPKTATDWSRDGRYIVYTETDAKTGADIWLLPLFGERKPVEYLRTPFNETQARVSPDGRWLAYRSDESGVEQVYVQSFPQAGSKWQVSTEAGRQPHWRGDGKELLYLSPVLDDQFMGVDILSSPSEAAFRAAVPNKLFVINVLTAAVPGGQSFQRNSYDVFKDGQRLLLNSLGGEVDATRRPVTVVVNWTAGLKK
jgi:Tol biopolymer transport system component